MTDPRIRRMATVLTEYSLELQPGQIFCISGTPLATELMLETYRAALKLEARPIINVQIPEQLEILLNEGNNEQIMEVTPFEESLSREPSADLRIISDQNTRALNSLDSQRLHTYTSARTHLRQQRMERAANGDLRWCLTLFPTHAHAQDADMSLDAYREFVFEACFLNDSDPVSRWRELSERQSTLINWLSPRKEIRVLAPETDLRLTVADRTWMNSDGKRNFPSGEIFTSPIEDSVEGVIYFNVPANIRGHRVAGIRLKFEAGKVVDASAQHNEAFFLELLELDEGARRVGEFAFGTNFGIQRSTGNTLFDEKIGGTVHLALGAGYPETGSTNKSAIHEDLVCDLRESGRVLVDGEPFLENGQYLHW